MDLRFENVALDIDGTLLDYSHVPGENPRYNEALIDLLLKSGVREVSLVSNQGGLVFGLMSKVRDGGSRRYPSPSDFHLRLMSLIYKLKENGIRTISLRVCTFHPKGSVGLLSDAARDVRNLLYDSDFDWVVHEGPDYRKPSPLMLEDVGATVYFGDSDEDEESAKNAGIVFVRVERYL